MSSVTKRTAARVVPLFAGLLLTSSLAAQTRLIVVDPNDPTADFHRIDRALNRSQSGAFIFVRAGSYTDEELQVVGKSVTVVAEPGATVDVQGTLLIADLQAGQQVTFVGLDLRGIDPGLASEVVHVRDCEGVVWIEEAKLRSATTGPSAQVPLLVEGSQQVLLVRADVDARTVVPAATPGGPGIDVSSSSLSIYDSSIHGGPAGADGLGTEAEGGPGIRQEAGALMLYGTQVVGGIGSPGSSGGSCADGGPGGPALELVGSPPTVRHRATTLTGGPGGLPVGAGICAVGPAGSSTRGNASAVVLVPTTATRTFDVTPNAVALGKPISLEFTGSPGDLAFLAESPDPTAVFVPALLGTVAVQPLLLVFPMGMIGLGGTLTVPSTPSFQADVQELRLQAVFYDLQGAHFEIGSPAALLVLPHPPRDKFDIRGR